ncbi:Bacterial regulatory protein, ArsR domain protein, partial [mine drainage metagenome]
LGRLTGMDGTVCLPKYSGFGRTIGRGPAFARALARARALSDEHRLTAVVLLKRHGELCACEIQAALGVTHATVSHHMRVLVAAGLVTPRRQGKWVYYALTASTGVDLP